MHMFSGTISVLALLFSIASFAYVNYDRRVRLLLRPRKGDWCVLDRATNGRETIFRGIIEIYNQSSRANAVFCAATVFGSTTTASMRTSKARWSLLLTSKRQANCST